MEQEKEAAQHQSFILNRGKAQRAKVAFGLKQ